MTVLIRYPANLPRSANNPNGRVAGEEYEVANAELAALLHPDASIVLTTVTPSVVPMLGSPFSNFHESRIRALVDKSSAHMHITDAFDRADTVAGGLGTSPSGRPWVLSEPAGANAQIVGGRYRHADIAVSRNTYAFQTLPVGYEIKAMWGGVFWSSLTAPQGISIVSSRYPETGFTANLIHLIALPTSVTLHKFVNGVVTTLRTVLVSLAANVRHEFGWRLVGDQVMVSYPGGTFTETDPDFLTIRGRTGYWQIRHDGAATGRAEFDFVDAFATAA